MSHQGLHSASKAQLNNSQYVAYSGMGSHGGGGDKPQQGYSTQQQYGCSAGTNYGYQQSSTQYAGQTQSLGGSAYGYQYPSSYGGVVPDGSEVISSYGGYGGPYGAARTTTHVAASSLPKTSAMTLSGYHQTHDQRALAGATLVGSSFIDIGQQQHQHQHQHQQQQQQQQQHRVAVNSGYREASHKTTGYAAATYGGASYKQEASSYYGAAQQSSSIAGAFSMHEAELSNKTIEVPLLREVIKPVTKVEIRTVEKIVEVPEYKIITREIEIPNIRKVEKVIEVEKMIEKFKYIPKIETVEVPREVIREVPRLETKTVENIREIQIPHHVDVDVEIQRPVAKVHTLERVRQVPVHAGDVVTTKEIPVAVPQVVDVPVEVTKIRQLVKRKVPVPVECPHYVPIHAHIDFFVPDGTNISVEECFALFSQNNMQLPHGTVNAAPSHQGTNSGTLNAMGAPVQQGTIMQSGYGSQNNLKAQQGGPQPAKTQQQAIMMAQRQQQQAAQLQQQQAAQLQQQTTQAAQIQQQQASQIQQQQAAQLQQQTTQAAQIQQQQQNAQLQQAQLQQQQQQVRNQQIQQQQAALLQKQQVMTLQQQKQQQATAVNQVPMTNQQQQQKALLLQQQQIAQQQQAQLQQQQQQQQVRNQQIQQQQAALLQQQQFMALQQQKQQQATAINQVPVTNQQQQQQQVAGVNTRGIPAGGYAPQQQALSAPQAYGTPQYLNNYVG